MDPLTILLANVWQLAVVTNGANYSLHSTGSQQRKSQMPRRFDEVPVDLQGSIFSLTLYFLPLTGLDLVLGIQWLELLGSMVCNWRRLTMEFSWENQTRRLVGIDGQEIQAASLNEISTGVCPGRVIFALCLQVIKKDPQDNINPSMQVVLREFSYVFTEVPSLPPTREIDRSIPLKEGTEPVNVRPYRYAHYQKEEIEKQVQEMLNSRLVQPSTSPFSSPILLVKKKDGN